MKSSCPYYNPKFWKKHTRPLDFGICSWMYVLSSSSMNLHSDGESDANMLHATQEMRAIAPESIIESVASVEHLTYLRCRKREAMRRPNRTGMRPNTERRRTPTDVEYGTFFYVFASWHLLGSHMCRLPLWTRVLPSGTKLWRLSSARASYSPEDELWSLISALTHFRDSKDRTDDHESCEGGTGDEGGDEGEEGLEANDC